MPKYVVEIKGVKTLEEARKSVAPVEGSNAKINIIKCFNEDTAPASPKLKKYTVSMTSGSKGDYEFEIEAADEKHAFDQVMKKGYTGRIAKVEEVAKPAKKSGKDSKEE